MNNGTIYKKCPTCKKDLFDWQPHTCEPHWYCVIPYWNDEDEPDSTYTHGGAKDAVEHYMAKNYEELDYPDEIEVWVKKERTNGWQKFVVSIETIPHFTASAIQEAK